MKLTQSEKYLFFYYLFCIFHLFSVITAMTLTSRIITLNNFLNSQIYFTGGLIVIPVVFFIQDIVTESYGYIYSQNMLKTSLILFILYVIFNLLISCFIGDVNNEYFVITTENYTNFVKHINSNIC